MLLLEIITSKSLLEYCNVFLCKMIYYYTNRVILCAVMIERLVLLC